MGNFETVRAITDNIRDVLKAEGMHFPRTNQEDEKNIPASLIPLGAVSYTGEAFEYTHGQRPGYMEAGFAVKVLLNERDPVVMTRQQQTWIHRIREALTVDALNTGYLASNKLVSRVTTDSVDVEDKAGKAVLTCRLRVRYRGQ